MIFVLFCFTVFLGLTWESDSLKVTADKYLSSTNMYDIQVSYKYGFDDDEIKLPKANDKIDLKIVIYIGFLYLKNLKLMKLKEYINVIKFHLLRCSYQVVINLITTILNT